MSPGFLVFNFFLFTGIVSAQKSPIYENLPVGKYAVGFKIITLTDSSRVTKPEYNYLGEKNDGDRLRRISIHLWYPAKYNPAKQTLNYGYYCYSSSLSATNEQIADDKKNNQLNNGKSSVERWFGKTTDDAWQKLVSMPMLAQPEAIPLREKFPLLIGILRSLSTSVTNELLASNGYVVAMINSEDADTFSRSALLEIPDMQFALNYLKRIEGIDMNTIGTFGFSGSGFSQVLFSMYDYRVKAVADIESGIYMDVLYQSFSASNYYDPAKLQVPFLHIFSCDLSKQEKYIADFEQKTKFSKRYRLIINQPALHHWDFAAEGYASCIVLKMRGAEQINIQHSFEIASVYLLNFFNAELKKDAAALTFLSGKPALPQIQPTLWDITVLNAGRRSPDRAELENIIRKKGIEQAMDIVRNTLKNDSATNITTWYYMNQLGYTFLQEQKYREAIEIFKLNTEMHPGDANLFDSLAEGYELSGDKENMKKVSEIIMGLLNKKAGLSDADKGIKGNAEKRLTVQSK